MMPDLTGIGSSEDPFDQSDEDSWLEQISHLPSYSVTTPAPKRAKPYPHPDSFACRKTSLLARRTSNSATGRSLGLKRTQKVTKNQGQSDRSLDSNINSGTSVANRLTSLNKTVPLEKTHTGTLTSGKEALTVNQKENKPSLLTQPKKVVQALTVRSSLSLSKQALPEVIKNIVPCLQPGPVELGDSEFVTSPVQQSYKVRTNQANAFNAANALQDINNRQQAIKRPYTTDTVEAAKKIKVDDNMLNGFRSTEGHNSHSNKSDDQGNNDGSPIATLLNIGNTCYLNSVIYTLRFTPFFLHNLHHLVDELTQVFLKLSQAKVKSSSLGRNIGGLASGNGRSWSTKDLPALGQGEGTPLLPMQVASERLHELYQSLHQAEIKEGAEPFQAETFLRAVQEVNSIFDGNQQQDAHELLMCVLDIIRETCKSLSQQVENQPELLNGCSSLPDNAGEEITPKNKLFNRKSIMKRTIKIIKPGVTTTPPAVTNGLRNSSDDESNLYGPPKRPPVGFDFIAQDFEGTTVSRTTCLNCEQVTERKQTMCDISVPILEDSALDDMESPSKIYQNACVTSENLRDEEKYFCAVCLRYNEARRSVSFETLPRLLILQLKRFSGGMEKINNFMPTPLSMSCFCNLCCDQPEENRVHMYKLYSIISHVGATMSVGHYIAYTRALDSRSEYMDCERTVPPKPNTTNTVVSEKGTTAFKKIFSRSKSSTNTNADKIPNGNVPVVHVCQGLSCCGIKLNRVTTNAMGDGQNNSLSSEPASVWFICDDERVKQISQTDFEDLISNKSNIKQTATPYLLFYVKSDIK